MCPLTAVESSARGFPVDTCSGTRQLQSDQSQANRPQPAKQGVKQVESSARRQVHMHKKGKKTRWRARRGALFASRQEPACLWKPNQARNYFSTLQSDLPLFLFSLSCSNQVPTDETPA